MSFKNEMIARALQYAEQNGLVLGKELGFGVHGIVFATESQAERGSSALKLHYQEPAYCRERDIYLRLRRHNVQAVRGCQVPQLLQFDDDLLAIDMTVVQRLCDRFRRRLSRQGARL